MVDGMGKTVTDYKNDLKKMILEDGLEQAGQTWKAKIQRVVDGITDWEDIDQLYDAARFVQNYINDETETFVCKSQWNEYKTSCRQHYHDQIQFVLCNVTYNPAEHKEYEDVLIQFKCMKSNDDVIWNIAHLGLKQLNQMVTELWKIKAHWMQKVDNGEAEQNVVKVYNF